MTAPDVTQLRLTSSSNPGLSFRGIDETATVTDVTNPGRTPAGTIVWYVDGNLHPRQQLNGQSSETEFFGAGTYKVQAAYCPDSNALRASVGTLSQTVVDHFASATDVTVSPDPTVAGQPARFTSTVSAVPPGSGTPTGTVQFTESDGSPIGPPVVLAAGKASLLVSAPAGQYTVHANYSGESGPSGFTASSGSVGQTVNKADTATTISSDTNPVVGGDDVTFTMFVTTGPPGAVPATGPVAIIIDGQSFGPIPLFPFSPTTSAVKVTFTAPTVPQRNTIGAAYSGDANTNPSSAPTFVQTVSRRPAPVRPRRRSRRRPYRPRPRCPRPRPRPRPPPPGRRRPPRFRQ